MHIETLAIHAGNAVDASTSAITQPIHLSTTFERAADGSYPHGYSYIRNHNPNREALEKNLCALEQGAAAAAFSSGTAAASAIFHALTPGDHIVAPNDIYYGIGRLLREILSTWHIETSFVELSDLAQVRQAIRPNTKLVWVETPSNPLMKISDLSSIARIAHEAGAVCACDNTFATPILQHPLALGVDLVMHSTTKYIGGHSDVLGGIVVTRRDDEFFQRIKKTQVLEGATPSPFDCWLLLRGIRTLPYRMRAHSENALKVAHFLNAHPRVEAVHYPGLQTHPHHDVAAEQMEAFGGMLSFQVRGERDRAMAVAAQVRLFTRATSLGGVESLIEHRASIEGPHSRTPQNLLRLSIGLEHPDDLIADLAQALE